MSEIANFVFNVAKARAGEFFYRVKNNDPANSVIVLVPIASAIAAATDGSPQAQTIDDLGTVLGRYTAAGASWGRKSLDDTLLASVTPDDVNNRFACTLPQVTWTAPTTGQNTGGLLICYDNDSTSGTDANIIPICHCDFSVTADGNDVILNAGDCLRAS